MALIFLFLIYVLSFVFFFFLHQCWDDKDGRKQMSKNNARGLTTLRQRLRRHNRDYENEIKKYREVTSFVGFLFWISKSLIELKNHFLSLLPSKNYSDENHLVMNSLFFFFSFFLSKFFVFSSFLCF